MQIQHSTHAVTPLIRGKIDYPAKVGFVDQAPRLVVWLGDIYLSLELVEAQQLANVLVSHLDGLSCAVAEHAATPQTPGAAVTPVAAAPGRPMASAS